MSRQKQMKKGDDALLQTLSTAHALLMLHNPFKDPENVLA